MWNTSGTREFSTIPDNGKLQLFECVENLLKYSSLNLLGKVKFNSGGRVVASSNLVTPTNRESLIFSRISRIFLLCHMVGKMAEEHKWYINGRYPKISISVVKYLVVGWLLYLGLYSRSEQADNEFYWVRGYMSCNRVAVSSVPTKQNDLPICFWQVLLILLCRCPDQQQYRIVGFRQFCIRAAAPDDIYLRGKFVNDS